MGLDPNHSNFNWTSVQIAAGVGTLSCAIKFYFDSLRSTINENVSNLETVEDNLPVAQSNIVD